MEDPITKIRMTASPVSMGLFGKIKDGGPVLREQAAELHWDTEDPFMFASHHFDDYPKGNRQQAPPLEEIKKRSLGHDYRPQYGYRMYGGKVAPGFPLHTHWGYETVTICSEGYVDHFDSLGNQGRYGYGDVQWLTAPCRYGHCEMYPLAFADRDNHHRVTQIMIHIPNELKNGEAELNNVWAEDVPEIRGNGYLAHVYAGTYGGKTGIVPNSRSWAADPAHRVRIVSFETEPGAEIKIDPTSETACRNVYLTDCGATVGGKDYIPQTRLKMKPGEEVAIVNGDKKNEIWLLEGEPIGQKMCSFGPVVLATDKEVREANAAIRKEEYKDWPWNFINKTQPVGTDRFIRYADGREERPASKDPRELPPAVPFPDEPAEEKKEYVPAPDYWNEE